MRKGETPFRVHITRAVTLAMQLVNVSVGVFGTNLTAGTGFLRTLLDLSLFSLPSSPVTFRHLKNKVTHTDLILSQHRYTQKTEKTDTD